MTKRLISSAAAGSSGTAQSRPTYSRRDVLRAIAAISAALPAAILPSRADAFGDEMLFDLPVIEYDAPHWNPRPSALRRILQEIDMVTSIAVADGPNTTRLDPDALFMSPIAVLAGDRGFDAWSDEQSDALSAWLRSGGLLFVDSSEGRADGGFADSVRRELARVLPDGDAAPISAEHVIFRSFYLVTPSPGRFSALPHLEGYSFDDRLAVIVSHNDILGACARDPLGGWEYEVTGGSSARDMALRFAVNLAMYATCLDYKADQVHVEYVMRRRRWRVD
jgi:hypothetical protein